MTTRSLKHLFQAEIVLSSALLFLIEPLAAKQLLPIFGGSASVWITCLVFFQTALLLGYLYTHVLTTRIARGRQCPLHITLVAAATLPAILWNFHHVPTATAAHPVAGIFLTLASTIGLPFLLLASTSPLLQIWQTRLEHDPIPYHLFGLSNISSLLALFAYPTLIEPHLNLTTQRLLWTVGLILFATLSITLAASVPHSQPTLAPRAAVSETPHRTRLLWFLLPLAASMQLSAISQHLTTNVAAIPLLWILPLAAYLLTFVVAFQFPRLIPRLPLAGIAAVLLIGLGQFLTNPAMALPIGLALALFLAELFVAALVCHSELYRLRPSATADATWFYLMIAAAGATGAFLIGIAAPLLFRANYDLSLTFALTAAILVAAFWPAGAKPRILGAAITALLLWFCIALRTAYTYDTLMTVRNFYGSLRVKRSVTPAGDDLRTLMHGTIVHGTQIFTPTLMRTPTTYYAPDTGIGLALANWCGNRPRSIGVVGLGVGTLAAYGRPGDTLRFYEINPAVQPIAQNLFTYLRQSPAAITFATGDARTSLAAEAPHHFDVLAIDAFSGDAIPLHLLTTQAMQVYLRQLAPGGVLAFHVSNQYVDLEPELAALAHASGLAARSITTEGNPVTDELRATWVLMTTNPQIFAQPAFAQAHPSPSAPTSTPGPTTTPASPPSSAGKPSRKRKDGPSQTPDPPLSPLQSVLIPVPPLPVLRRSPEPPHSPPAPPPGR